MAERLGTQRIGLDSSDRAPPQAAPAVGGENGGNGGDGDAVFPPSPRDPATDAPPPSPSPSPRDTAPVSQPAPPGSSIAAGRALGEAPAGMSIGSELAISPTTATTALHASLRLPRSYTYPAQNLTSSCRIVWDNGWGGVTFQTPIAPCGPHTSPCISLIL